MKTRQVFAASVIAREPSAREGAICLFAATVSGWFDALRGHDADMVVLAPGDTKVSRNLGFTIRHY